MLQPAGPEGGGRGGGGRGGNWKGGKKVDSPCHKVIKMAMEHDLAPVIVFSFSKKDCENYALQLSKMDFNTGKHSTFVFEQAWRQ